MYRIFRGLALGVSCALPVEIWVIVDIGGSCSRYRGGNSQTSSSALLARPVDGTPELSRVVHQRARLHAYVDACRIP